jgi:ribonuclease BN (tRNA processing enzyme)
MKIVALGGSAAGANPGAGSAGFLVTSGTTSIVFDLGPGTLLELRKHVDVHELSAVIISHYHLDHVLDLGSFRYLLSYGPRQPTRKVPLFIPPGTRAYLDRWALTFGHGDRPDFFDDVFDVKTYDPSETLSIGDLQLQFAPTVHPVQGWAMRVHGPTGSDFGYTADAGPTANLSSFFSNVGLLASEATEMNEPADETFEQRGHLTATEAGSLATTANTTMLMLTHMWQENGPERAVADAATRFAGPIVIARPGLSIHI